MNEKQTDILIRQAFPKSDDMRISISTSLTITQLKQTIHERYSTHPPVDQQQLVLKAKLLQDEDASVAEVLKDYSLADASTPEFSLPVFLLLVKRSSSISSLLSTSAPPMPSSSTPLSSPIPSSSSMDHPPAASPISNLPEPNSSQSTETNDHMNNFNHNHNNNFNNPIHNNDNNNNNDNQNNNQNLQNDNIFNQINHNNNNNNNNNGGLDADDPDDEAAEPDAPFFRNLWTLIRLGGMIFILSDGGASSRKFVILLGIALLLYLKEIGLINLPHIALLRPHQPQPPPQGPAGAPADPNLPPPVPLLPNGRPKPQGVLQEVVAFFVPFILSLYPNWQVVPVFNIN